jgi:hypothetical protein
MTASRDPRAHIGWGVSSYYPGRVHLVPHGCAVGLCRMPVHENCHRRTPEPRICPECAIAWVAAFFPPIPQWPEAGETT